MSEEIMNNETVVETTETEEQEQMFTKEEVMKMIQSESDKRVTQALKTQKEKLEKEKSLSALDKESRDKVETQEKIAQLEAQVRDMNALQAKQEVITVLSNRGLNTSFADLISIGDNAEEAIAKIDKLEKMFKQAVQAEVKQRLAQNGGIVKDGIKTEGITKEEFNKMTLSQQSELYATNPELYKQLSR